MLHVGNADNDGNYKEDVKIEKDSNVMEDSRHYTYYNKVLNYSIRINQCYAHVESDALTFI